VAFFDLTNRYFGDYHRVCIEVRLTVPLVPGCEASAAGPAGLSKGLERTRHLERMGVAGTEVAAVCARLVDDFLRTTGRYLAHPDYPARLAAAQSAAPRRLRSPDAH
jgi:hypothetical protein